MISGNQNYLEGCVVSDWKWLREFRLLLTGVPETRFWGGVALIIFLVVWFFKPAFVS